MKAENGASRQGCGAAGEREAENGASRQGCGAAGEREAVSGRCHSTSRSWEVAESRVWTSKWIQPHRRREEGRLRGERETLGSS